MDRMAQTALNSMKNLMENQMATAHNLSNLSTPGF
jgi:flagellar basal body rod protein FlgF